MFDLKNIINILLPTASDLKAIIYGAVGATSVFLLKYWWDNRNAQKSIIQNRNQRLVSTLNMFLTNYQSIFEEYASFKRGDVRLITHVSVSDEIDRDKTYDSLHAIKPQLSGISSYLASLIHEVLRENRNKIRTLANNLQKMSLNSLQYPKDIEEFTNIGDKSYRDARSIVNYLSKHLSEEF